jgi:hypothetical protein
MIDDLKAAIPYPFRDWNPARKVWTVAPAYADLALEILLHHFPTADVPGRSGEAGRSRSHSHVPPGPRPLRHRDARYAVLHLLPSAPPELIEGAYRILARLHHPDRGGSTAAMQEINEAIADLRERSA